MNKLQLVSKESILPITVAFSYDGTYSQIKSKGNKKPRYIIPGSWGKSKMRKYFLIQT